MDLEALLTPTPERRPWPHHGQTYEIIFEVEYIGLHWADEPLIRVLAAPEAIKEYISDCGDLRVLCNDDYLVRGSIGSLQISEARLCGNTLPVASGLWRGKFEFWFHDDHSTTEGYDCEYGFYVRALEKLQ